MHAYHVFDDEKEGEVKEVQDSFNEQEKSALQFPSSSESAQRSNRNNSKKSSECE